MDKDNNDLIQKNKEPIENMQEAIKSEGTVPEIESLEEEKEGWEAFQEIAKGDFKRLLGCGG